MHAVVVSVTVNDLEAARAMAEQVRGTERGAVVIDSVETGPVVASA